MRQFLLAGIISSSCLMILFGFQNCTRDTHVKSKSAHIHYVDSSQKVSAR